MSVFRDLIREDAKRGKFLERPRRFRAKDPAAERLLVRIKHPSFSSDEQYDPKMRFSKIGVYDYERLALSVDCADAPLSICFGRMSMTWMTTCDTSPAYGGMILIDDPGQIQKTLKALKELYAGKIGKPETASKIEEHCLGSTLSPSGIPIPSYTVSVDENNHQISAVAGLLVFEQDMSYRAVPIGTHNFKVRKDTDGQYFFNLGGVFYVKVTPDHNPQLSRATKKLLTEFGLPHSVGGIVTLDRLHPEWRDNATQKTEKEIEKVGKENGIRIKPKPQEPLDYDEDEVTTGFGAFPAPPPPEIFY